MNTNLSEKAKLVARWRKMLEHKKMSPLTNRKKPIVAQMLENLYKRSKGLLKEDTTGKLTTADIQTFDTVLIPMIRRIAPELIALDILGTQVMEKPTQLIFALRAFPAGRKGFDTVGLNPNEEHFGYALPGGREHDGTNNPTNPHKLGMALIVNKADSGFFSDVEQSGTETLHDIMNDPTKFYKGYFLGKYRPDYKGSDAEPLTIFGKNVVFEKTVDSAGEEVTVVSKVENTFANGVIYYAEETAKAFKIIVGMDYTDKNAVAFNKWMIVDSEDFTVTVGQDYETVIEGKTDLTDVFENEIMYNIVFKGYSGTYTTDEMEKFRTWNEVKFDISSTTVEAKGRLLKSRYSLEVAEDLMAYHSLDAEEELMNMISYEILAEMNREVVDRIYSAAVSGGNGIYRWEYGNQFEGADGRWAAEKYHSLYTLMNKMAGDIAIATRRGTANFAICSMATKVALESVGGYSLWTDVNNNFNSNAGVVYAGTLGGKYKIYVDTFATSNYILMGYKGSSEYDAGLFYCPFIPLTACKAVDPENFQPRLGFRTRYGIGSNPLGANLYYRLCTVDGLDNSFGATYSYVSSDVL